MLKKLLLLLRDTVTPRRLRIARALELALTHYIEPLKSHYTCTALISLRFDGLITKRTAWEARKYLMDELYPNVSYDGLYLHSIPRQQRGLVPRIAVIHARAYWLKSLILELRAGT
jgi:hypothetical protein